MGSLLNVHSPDDILSGVLKKFTSKLGSFCSHALHMLSMCLSGFPPNTPVSTVQKPSDLCVKGYSKLPVGVNVNMKSMLDL